MRQPQYVEGPKALENFKQGMEALFRVPKDKVVQPKRGKAVSSPRKPKNSDKD
jgi:hypothetical protein